MPILLKNFFSPEINKVVSEAELPQDNQFPLAVNRPHGTYCDLANHCVGLFSFSGRLFIFVDGIANDISNSLVTSSFHRTENNCQLVLEWNGKVITIEYANTRLPVSSPFYSEDDEDSDFGLWLTNVLGSGERRAIFLENNG